MKKQRSMSDRTKHKKSKHDSSKYKHGVVARAMRGPPAAQYARYPTNATALKSVDNEFSANFTAAGAVSYIPPPIQGAGFFNRLGNRTRGVSLQFRGRVATTADPLSATAQGDIVARIIIGYDRQINGTPAPVSTYLQSINNAGGTITTDAYTMLSIANRDRIEILRDRMIVLSPVGVAGVNGYLGIVGGGNNSENTGLNYTEFIKLNGKESQYNTVNGGTVADITTGAYFILLITDDTSAVGHESWKLEMGIRYKFLD